MKAVACAHHWWAWVKHAYVQTKKKEKNPTYGSYWSSCRRRILHALQRTPAFIQHWRNLHETLLTRNSINFIIGLLTNYNRIIITCRLMSHVNMCSHYISFLVCHRNHVSDSPEHSMAQLELPHVIRGRLGGFATFQGLFSGNYYINHRPF